jgi:hypothetical protein
MQSPYIKNVIHGLILAGISLGFAGSAAVALFVFIAWTQSPWIVSVVPVVLIGVFLVITLAVLQRDAAAVKTAESRDA